MSDMLEQAIIDASALKEAATKNAETLVLEKYSGELKKAVESLLEQEDPMAGGDSPDLGLGNALGMPEDAPAEAAAADPNQSAMAAVMEHIPLAATMKEDEQIEIPLDKLMEEVTKMSETFKFNGDEIFDEDLFESIERELEEGYDDTLEEDFDLNEAYYEEDLDEDLELEEDLEEQLEYLEEKLKVDVGLALEKRGWAGLPESHVRLAEEELLALEQDSEIREEKAALRAAVKELGAVNEVVSRENKKLTKFVNESTKHITKLRDAILVLKEKFDKASLENAKLLYQNKALTSDSLNERQKQKLAEAVRSAETIEEAKVIFETLQNTVGSTSRKQQPNSLSEAVEKTSSVILSARNNKSNLSESNNASPTLERWKFLAGIDKN